MILEREKFTAEELKLCLRHYDLGKIQRIQQFARGSRRSPKVIIESTRGKFLFKRRGPGKDDIQKVAFTHQIQLKLAARGFPLPHIIGARKENNSMLVLDSNIYEMFEFIPGTNYDSSAEATLNAGKVLGLYHKLLAGFHSDYAPPTGSYHDAGAIHQAIRSTVSSLPLANRPPAQLLTDTVSRLENAYKLCAAQANALGLNNWEVQIVHGDWHPGNMLFTANEVAAVIDYDAARVQQRVIDLSNGALQFSIVGGGDDPSVWPGNLDQRRFRQFMRGYDSVNVISVAEIKAVPFLMCEAMIAEAVLPIAATGSFGRIQGFPFLQMIDRKVRWILDHLKQLSSVMGQ